MGLNTLKRQIISSGAMGTGDLSSDWIDTMNLQSGSFSFVWSSGSTPVGTVVVDISNNDAKSDLNELTLSTTLTVSGSSGAHIANLDVIPCRFIRLRYKGTSGSATANAWFAGKGDAN